MTYHEPNGLEALGSGAIRPAAMAQGGRTRQHDDEPTAPVTVDVPEEAGAAARLFAGYNPNWVEPESNYGKGMPRAKLNPRKVRRIRALISAGKSKRAIGRLFDVSDKTICNIDAGVCWGWVA